jgi:hypothetical protein
MIKDILFRILEDYRLRVMNMLGRKENIMSNEKLKVVWESIANKITNTHKSNHVSQLKKLFNVALAWQMSKILKRIWERYYLCRS